MNKNLYKIYTTSMLVASLFLWSCSKDHADDDDCINEKGKSEISFNLKIDNPAWPIKDIEIADSLQQTRSENSGKAKIIRYHVCLYRILNGKLSSLYRTESVDQSQFSMSLPIGKYRVIGWAEYAEPDNMEDKGYFYMDDFADILLRNKFSYPVHDNYKTAFYGTGDLAVAYKNKPYELKLDPAMGQFQIVATDEPNYNIGKIAVTYNTGLPASFDAVHDMIVYSWMGFKYYASNVVTSDCATFDNIMTGPNGFDCSLKVEIYDDNGHLRARRKNLSFPVKRGEITKVHAKLFTILDMDDNTGDDNGGSIDDEYDNTYFIEITR